MPIRTKRWQTWAAAAGALMVASCAGATEEYRRAALAALAPCEGTPVLTVHNNTSAAVEIYEYRRGVKSAIAVVRPGTETVVVSGDAAVSYGAQPVGGTEVLATTGRPRAAARVRLERGCR